MNRLNLNELDQQLINCTQMNQKSNVSYGQLYDIARSIVSIDFGQTAAHNINTNHESNKKNDTDHEEMEKTLTKILQLCQTIIDFLLADIRRLELENKESTIGNSNNNNLLQENRKLRKLLQLQQKSIIYRRINFSQEIHTLPDQQQQSSIIDQNGNNDDDNNSSLYSLDQLPSDSLKSNSSSKIQCTFCLKIFSDSQAFTKHLQLRHFFSSCSNVDDPSSISLQSSITSNISFVQRILQQHCCLKQQQELSQSNTDITISVDKIEELSTEFDVLKNKLIKTETQLNEEKMARKIFENDLKNNFDEQIQSIKTKLENKIRKIQSATTTTTTQSEDEKFGSKIDEMFDENEQKSSRKSNENIEQSSNNLERTIDKKSIQSENVKNKIILNEQKTDDKKLKQNLRMELISQLTTKREQRHKQQQPIPIIEPKKSEEKTKNKKDLKKEETRLKQTKNVADSEIGDEKSSNNNNRIGEKTEQTNKEQVKSDIYNSIETRIKSYLENENDDENDGQNDHFNQAMRRIQDDRNLLIQQSRHDYDFVKIETSIRDIIDMKLKNKIEKNDDKQTSTDQTSNETSGHSNVEIVEIETQMPKQLPEKKKQSTVVSSKDSPNETKTTTTNNLKSILKEPGKIAENKRNITFNNEVIEFEISPLNSDNDDDGDDDIDGDWTLSDDDHQQTNGQNIVKEIETINTVREQPSINNSNRMFNIVDDLNLDQNLDDKEEKPEEISSISSSTTSSTTSSEDENEQVIRKMPNPTESVNNPIQQQQQMIKVDVHDKSENSISIMPIPAKRKNVSQPTINNTATIGFNNTLNSLLDDKLSNDNDRTKNDQTLRVSELAEMIEKKLQSPARSSLSQNAVNNNSTKKLPPLGTLANLKKSSSPTSSSNNQSIAPPSTTTVNTNKSDLSFLNNSNLNTRNNILDAYDLYEF
ncbi:hypothetical protein DERP_002478 [Dermatophagoides pteronyssinus]|uniref:C2H2-type domain-containing protein n=1 Tax=Dermatophagoides pteronyssinus TaxID=6956 RepID=A0ABQ8JHV0_DERPT|nr:hypothetical protein DERP_002478 [Dermatophagoides pteronyssinus]